MTLPHIRVLELGDLVSAPYCTKLLADLGAQVIKVESPDGDRARSRGPFPTAVSDVGADADAGEDVNASGLFLALNTNKDSVVVGSNDHDRMSPLLASADILVTNWDDERLASFGIDLDVLHHDRPELVICAISPFGRSGPYAHYVAEELTVSHAGGWAYQCPGASPDDHLPPLKVFGHQTDFHAGMAASTVAVASYLRAVDTGVGDLIDFSAMAHTAGMLEAALIGASYMGENPSRLGSRLLNPWGIYPCADGLIFMVCVETDQWDRLVALMGEPEWTELGLFDTLELRLANEDLLTHYLSEWTTQHTVEELFAAGQAQRICFAPVQTMAAMADSAHLQAREFFEEVEHPVAGRLLHLGQPFLAEPPMRIPTGAAPLFDPTAEPSFEPGRRREPSTAPTSAPLEGVRVLDLSWVWAGPYCTMHLAYLGAEVTKIESATRPGLGRRLPLHPPDVTPSLNTSAYFNQWDQGKFSCELDLSTGDGIDRFMELVATADVVVENFATGVMERLGLGYDALRTANPEIIVASIAGYGATGPLQNYMGYGPTTGPLSGLSSLTGYADGPPRELGIAVGDPGAGITAAFAITAALAARRAGGGGRYLDIALWESTASNAVEGWMHHEMGGSQPERMGNRDPRMAPHNCYPAAGDDQWVSVACADDASWQRLAMLIDPGLASDARFASATDRKRHEDALDAIVAAWTATRDRWATTTLAQASGIAAFPSMSPQDLLADSHLEARKFFERLEHAEVGTRTHTGVPWHSRTAHARVRRPAPLLGEHTAETLGLV